MTRITRGTRLFAICITAASSALVWLPAAVASAAPAATSAAARSAAPAHPAASTAKAGSAAAAAQAAAKTGVISGTVIGPAGVPLAGICVTATGPGGRLLARTNGAGGYSIAGLSAGVYTVGYTDCASPDSYAAKAYPGGSVSVVSGQRTSLEPVALTAASPVQAIATEQAYAQAHESAATAAKVKYAVAGTVRNKAGKPLAGICVTGTARISLKLSPKGHTYYYELPTSAKTNSQGFYQIRGFTLPPKYYHLLSWKVLFEVGCGNGGNYAPQWWHGAASAGKAAALGAKSHEITGVDATLTEGGKIAGVITGRNASGPGLKGACVQATGIFGQAGVSILTHTGAGGRYVLRGLGSGNYNVSFSACNAGNYLNAKYGRVFARVGATKRVSGFLEAGAMVAGTVTSSQASHAKLAKICVYLTSTRFGIYFATTAKSGRYSIDRLTHGSYFVTLYGCGNTGSYAPEFYRAGASTGVLNAATATTIKLGVGEHYTASVAMLPGGTIEGTVTAQASGAHLRDVCVAAEGESGYLGFFFGGGGPIIPQPFGLELTNSAGQYRLANLRPGRYVVNFSDCFGSAYAGTWFAPEGGISPQWLFVPAGVTTSVDAALLRSGTISGTVTNQAGRGVQDVCVEVSQPGAVEPSVIDVVGSVGSAVAFTSKTGKYRIGGLPPGQYSVVFAPGCILTGKYAAQLYRDKAPGSAATAVAIRAGHTTANINAKLTSGKSVSGVVISGITGKPVRACLIVGAESPDLVPAVYSETSKSGRFTLHHVVAGTYQVEASPCGAGGAQLATIETEIRIPAGHSTATIRLRLPRSGSIAGTVTAPGVPGGGAYACAEVSYDSGTVVAIAFASRSGHYTLTDLAPGNYQVQIDDVCSGGTTLAPLVTSVHVSSGAATKVTTALVASGSITGSVTSSASSGPVAGICVGAFAGASATEPTAIAITAANGSYQVGTLSPGSYLVKFSSGCGAKGYVTQWYDNATTAATATSVTVSRGAAVSGVDASLSS